MTKRISILGCTGSIGTQALDVCSSVGFAIETLVAGSNAKLLVEQARQYMPTNVVIQDCSKLDFVKGQLAELPIKIYSGTSAVEQLSASDKADVVLNSIVGIAGLVPTMAAINSGKDIALANKETLVAGGNLVMEAAKRNKVKILPVDSEHSAIFQCLNGENWDKIERVLLTASGGPFFGYSTDELKTVTKQQALKHPNWVMGSKITIDSSTLMNKGLELIEAMQLFKLSANQVQIVVHRESIVHSGVEFIDGSVITQMGSPDMRIPIQYALTYPDRISGNVKKLSLFDVEKLSFYPADIETFTCLKFAIRAAQMGGTAPAIINGANEMAVSLFLNDKISYYNIFEIAGSVLDNVSVKNVYNLDDVFEADRLAREYANNWKGVTLSV